jgi:hypothetical protein
MGHMGLSLMGLTYTPTVENREIKIAMWMAQVRE